MVTAYIAFGSNLGDRQMLIQQALALLARQEHVTLQRVSPVYETQAEGLAQSAPPFLNGAAELQVECPPRKLLDILLHIESQLGRTRTRTIRENNLPQSRPIDLDLLLYGDQIISEPELIIPHPRLHARWFVLKPLSDLCPRLPLPGMGKTVEEALRALASRPAA
ncbi:MAG: 2-amino-4-hydroxy-6-hydroxymethyldihydropteridine diphosphokinase [bacterium]